MSSPGRELYREGFLQKAGKRSFQAWRRRWFILNGTIVKYYPTQEITEANLLGSIDMSEVVSIVLSRTVKNGFEISTNSRKYCVSAKSEEERSEWMSILKRANQIGQQVQRQRSVNSFARDASVDANGEEKPAVLPSSLYDTLKEAESSKKGRSSSKISMSSTPPRQQAAIPISIHQSEDSDDNLYDLPKSSLPLTDDEEHIGGHYKSPRQLSVNENQWQRRPSTSDDDLDARSDQDEADSHAKRFSRRHHSVDSIATIDSADYTEVESEEDESDGDEIDGNEYMTIDHKEVLPTPRSDDGKYAVETIKTMMQSTQPPTDAELDAIMTNINCKYADLEYPAFSALKSVLKIS